MSTSACTQGVNYGMECQKQCVCDLKKFTECNPVWGCRDCKDGYNGTKCQNINECTTGTSTCTPHSSCRDTIGSYACDCDQGFVMNGTLCDGKALPSIRYAMLIQHCYNSVL